MGLLPQRREVPLSYKDHVQHIKLISLSVTWTQTIQDSRSDKTVGHGKHFVSFSPRSDSQGLKLVMQAPLSGVLRLSSTQSIQWSVRKPVCLDQSGDSSPGADIAF